MPLANEIAGRRAARLLAWAWLLACAAALAQPTDWTHAPVWRVVLIRNWDSLYTVNLLRETALRDAILEKAPRVVEFVPEELDPLRFPADMEGDIVALMRRKYRDLPVDLVVVQGIESLEFAARNRDTIWPGTPILVNGVFEGSLEGRRLPPRTTGLALPLDIDGTLDVGRALVPAAKDVYVVSGSSPYDRTLLALSAPSLAKRDDLRVHYLADMTVAEVTASVAQLPADSFVVYLTMLRDANGQLSGPLSPAMARVAAASTALVLSPFHSQVGRGPMGGSVARFDEHGRAAGKLARRILEGADPDSIPIRTMPEPECILDWGGLARWQLPERNVPSGCQLLNRPPDPVKEYLWPILGGIAVILLQSALLSALLLQRRLRRAAEARLLARTAELSEQSRLSMVGALTANIAHEINQPMGAILSNSEAALMMLDQGTLTPDKAREILNDIRADDMRASEVIRELRKLFARSKWNTSALEVNTEVAEVLDHLSHEAERRGVTLAPSYGGEVPAVMGDPVQLQQVVMNLALNAIEAVADAPGARREVRVETHARRDGAEIVVADEGPGLSDEDAKRLFEAPFTTKKESMGFGLAIARSIVEMHHGRVWFEPNVPRGAVFRVWLPAIGTQT